MFVLHLPARDRSAARVAHDLQYFEGVLWMVMREPLTVSTEQIAIFARLHPTNARPVQRTAGRLIKQSN